MQTSKNVEDEATMFFGLSLYFCYQNEHVWYINSGCSNYKASRESLLVNVDKSVTSKVNIGKEQLVQATRKGYFS